MKKLVVGLAFAFLLVVTMVSADCVLTDEAKQFAEEHKLGLPKYEAACRMLNYRASQNSERCDIVLPATKFREEQVFKDIGVWGRNSLTGKKDICFVPGNSGGKKKVDSVPTVINPPVEEPECRIETVVDCVKQEKQEVCEDDKCKTKWVCVEEKEFEQEVCGDDEYLFECSKWKKCKDTDFRTRTCSFSPLVE